MKPFYVTTPIYYVNDRPHIGHAYTTVLADVLTRFHRSLGADTFFLTGTDEHGQKVQDAAKSRGMTPQEHCDDMHRHFRELWPTLLVEPSRFIRTTEDGHKRVVQTALQTLFDSGDIYEKEYEGWYSPSVERYWTEKDLVDGKCPESGAECVFLRERNYFFRMSQYQEPLIAHIQANPAFIQPSNRRNEVLGFLQNELRDLCISRPKSRLSWGIELPFDSDFVTYVWFDALLNYATGIGVFEDSSTFQKWWAESTHLLGKDILTTHCVYWPTFLMALGLPLPKRLVAHGWWLMGGSKMSKSVGNVINPFLLGERFGVESLRYFLIRDMTLSQDASFQMENYVARHNGDLANDLGNLLSRTTKLLQKDCFGGVVPEPQEHSKLDAALVSEIEALPGIVRKHVEAFELNVAVEKVLGVVRSMNRYIAETAPFKVMKTDPSAAGGVLYNLLEGLRFVGALLTPVLPESGPRIVGDVGWTGPIPKVDELHFGDLKAGSNILAGGPLFARVDKKQLAAWAAEDEKARVDRNEPAEDNPSAEEGKGMIEYADFAKMEMVVGKVIEAAKVEKASKLLCVQVDIGSETRQVVAGIAKYYTPEDLVGRSIVLLKNLKPRSLFGLESQGMILAAEDGEGKLVVVSPSADVEPGAEVA